MGFLHTCRATTVNTNKCIENSSATHDAELAILRAQWDITNYFTTPEVYMGLQGV